MKAVIVGLGSHDRGDDCVGLAVADAVAAAGRGDARVVEWTSDPLTLLELDELPAADLAIVVDAMSSGVAPGTLERFERPVETLPPLHDPSGTRALDLRAALARAIVRGRLPQRLVIYGIEAGRCERGAGLSPPVAGAVRAAAQAILAELGGHGDGCPPGGRGRGHQQP